MIAIHKLKTISKKDLSKLMTRAHQDIDKIKPKVEAIIETVRIEGDEELVRFTQQWDDPHYDISRLKVTKADIDEAYSNTTSDITNSIKEQISLSKRFREF